ncbi:MAG: hypothetical protein M3Z01_05290 [Thermoproteota archaeon]|nr:hypothetical protein [Thermoproteota archaeon]
MDIQKRSNPENPENDYWYFETKDGKGNISIGGGMMKRQSQGHAVTNYINVSSIDEYTSKIEKAGDKRIIPKIGIPKIGFMTICLDIEITCLDYELNK